jgi:hypothetical protein
VKLNCEPEPEVRSVSRLSELRTRHITTASDVTMEWTAARRSTTRNTLTTPDTNTVVLCVYRLASVFWIDIPSSLPGSTFTLVRCFPLLCRSSSRTSSDQPHSHHACNPHSCCRGCGYRQPTEAQMAPFPQPGDELRHLRCFLFDLPATRSVILPPARDICNIAFRSSARTSPSSSSALHRAVDITEWVYLPRWSDAVLQHTLRYPRSAERG